MKFLPRSLTLSVPLFLMAALAGVAPLRADSVERIPATAEDLASALGMDLKKFSAKFAEPVYATLTLSWRQPGDEMVNQLKHSSIEPSQECTILFTRKDYGRMQQKTGGTNGKALKNLLEMDVKFSGTGFFYRDVDPFAKLPGNLPIQTFVKEQSFEDLPLNEPIPLVIEAAADGPDKMMTIIQTQYATSPAFVHLSVTFSKERPEPSQKPAAADGAKAESVKKPGAAAATTKDAPAGKPEAKPAAEPKK